MTPEKRIWSYGSVPVKAGLAPVASNDVYTLIMSFLGLAAPETSNPSLKTAQKTAGNKG